MPEDDEGGLSHFTVDQNIIKINDDKLVQKGAKYFVHEAHE